MTQTSNTPYKEITLPAGTFRMYDDRPYVWVEVPRNDGYDNWVHRGYAMANGVKK